jgi:hypothetical protein
MRHACSIGIMVLTLAAAPAAARNDGRAGQLIRSVPPPAGATDNPRNAERLRGLAALAASDTTWLHAANFDSGALCNPQGWTAVDRTAPTGTYWHVERLRRPYPSDLSRERSRSGAAPARVRPDSLRLSDAPRLRQQLGSDVVHEELSDRRGRRYCGTRRFLTLRYDSEPSYDGHHAGIHQRLYRRGGMDRDRRRPSVGWTGVGTINVSNSYNVEADP